MIIMWDKPRKKMSKDAWKEDYGFEDGPAGGYQPNMSADDSARWKGKITGTKLGYPQVEIRKAAGSLMTIIINLGDGYNYKQYRSIPDEKSAQGYRDQVGSTNKGWLATYADAEYFELCDCGTGGINVHMSMNGPSTLSFTEMAELSLVVEEAKATLEAMIGPGERQPYVVYTSGSTADLREAIKDMKGCRVRAEYPALNALSLTATEDAKAALEKLSSVTEVLSHAAAKKREGRAYNVRHGRPANEDEDDD